MDPEIEYVNPAGAVEPGTRHGLDAFTKALEKVLEAMGGLAGEAGTVRGRG